jgi:hypothetical protein
MVYVSMKDGKRYKLRDELISFKALP